MAKSYTALAATIKHPISTLQKWKEHERKNISIIIHMKSYEIGKHTDLAWNVGFHFPEMTRSFSEFRSNEDQVAPRPILWRSKLHHGTSSAFIIQ